MTRYIVTYQAEAQFTVDSDSELSAELVKREGALDSNGFGNVVVKGIQDFDNLSVELPTE